MKSLARAIKATKVMQVMRTTTARTKLMKAMKTNHPETIANEAKKLLRNAMASITLEEKVRKSLEKSRIMRAAYAKKKGVNQ